jgi:peroxiredoxin 2/4
MGEGRISRILEVAPDFEPTSRGFQTADANGVSYPGNWRPGKQVIVPAPATLADAAKRTNGGGAGLNIATWYLAKKDLALAAR